MSAAFSPQCVVFDGWSSSLTTLKAVRNCGWTWLTRLKANRLVSQDHQPKVPVSRLGMTGASAQVHLKGYGRIQRFRVVIPLLSNWDKTLKIIHPGAEVEQALVQRRNRKDPVTRALIDSRKHRAG